MLDDGDGDADSVGASVWSAVSEELAVADVVAVAGIVTAGLSVAVADSVAVGVCEATVSDGLGAAGEAEVLGACSVVGEEIGVACDELASDHEAVSAGVD